MLAHPQTPLGLHSQCSWPCASCATAVVTGPLQALPDSISFSSFPPQGSPMPDAGVPRHMLCMDAGPPQKEGRGQTAEGGINVPPTFRLPPGQQSPNQLGMHPPCGFPSPFCPLPCSSLLLLGSTFPNKHLHVGFPSQTCFQNPG